jgi:hypothetical protein
MTYNFDPDRWYENELFVIQSKYESGQMTKQVYDKAVEALDSKHAKKNIVVDTTEMKKTD